MQKNLTKNITNTRGTEMKRNEKNHNKHFDILNALCISGQNYFQFNNFKQTITNFENFLKYINDHNLEIDEDDLVFAYKMLSICYFKEGETQETISYARTALSCTSSEKHSIDSLFYYNLIKAYHKTKNFQCVIDVATEALEEHIILDYETISYKHLLKIHTYLAESYSALGSEKGALKSYEQALLLTKTLFEDNIFTASLHHAIAKEFSKLENWEDAAQNLYSSFLILQKQPDAIEKNILHKNICDLSHFIQNCSSALQKHKACEERQYIEKLADIIRTNEEFSNDSHIAEATSVCSSEAHSSDNIDTEYCKCDDNDDVMQMGVSAFFYTEHAV